MLGEAFDLLGQPLPGERLQSLDNAGMEHPPPLLQEAPVGHLVGEGMLEGILVVGKEPCLVEELGRLEVHETAMERRLGQLGDGLQQRQGDFRPDDGGGLEEAFLLRWEPIHTRG